MKNILTLMLLLAALTSIHAAGFSGNTVAEEGAWCWFADPRALHYENQEGTINATYAGYIDIHGSIKATQVDWLTGTTSEVLIRSWFQPDDHDNPAFLVLPDERIMIIYSRHTDEACFYYRISKRPGDITALGEEKRLATANNTTYPNPYILSDDPEHIYMCWRGIGWHPTVAQMSMPDENDDIQFTWGPYQMVQSTGARPYAKYMSDGKSKIYLAYTTGHPDNEYPNWLYLNVFDVNDKCLYDLNGKKLSTVQNGKFNVNKTDSYKQQYPATVVDAPSDRRDWIWNMAFDDGQRPVIGMTRISNDKKTHDYYYARWTGSAWKVSFVANGGGQFHHSTGVEMCYSSGMAVDRDNPSTVYCGVPVDGIHEIWRYQLDDNGNVTVSEAVTNGSEKSNSRPFVIEGTKNATKGADQLRLMWMNGDYYYWIVNTTYKQAYPTSIMAETTLPQNTTATEGQTWQGSLTISPDQYQGDLLTMGGVVFGVNAQQYAYIKVGDQTYTSQNVLGTADSWQTENTATTGGKWFTKTKLGRFNLAVTYDATLKQLTTYVNGLIDQQIDTEASLAEASTASGVSLHQQTLLEQCASQQTLKQAIIQQELEAISVPETIHTDIVLPTTTANGMSVVWASDNEDILSTTGIANLPKQETEVTLTATVGGLQRSFTTRVMPRDISNNQRAAFHFNGQDTGITLMGNAKLTDGQLDLTANTLTGFQTNGYAVIDEGLLKGLRSYTVLLTATPKALQKAPRLYDLGGNSGNSVFLRANELAAGIKLNGGTTTMVKGSKQLTAGKEVKMAVTFDAASKTTTIYIDGEEDAKGTNNQNEPYMVYDAAGDARNYLGRTQWWDGSYANDNADYQGTMDDVLIYDIALTRKEICALQDIPYEEKEYSASIANPDFEGSYSTMQGSGVSSDRAIYLPEGWSVEYTTRNENDLTALKTGDLYFSQFFASKPQNPEGGQQTYWVRQRWGTSDIAFFQEVRPEQGSYTLNVDAFASDNSAKSHAFVGRTQKNVTQVNAWQTLTFDFEADGEEVLKIGFRTIHENSDAERICAFDNFILTKNIVDGIENATTGKTLSHEHGLYDLTGRKLNSQALKKGIYIKDGRKLHIGGN
jgi:hypothetical protein